VERKVGLLLKRKNESPNSLSDFWKKTYMAKSDSDKEFLEFIIKALVDHPEEVKLLVEPVQLPGLSDL